MRPDIISFVLLIRNSKVLVSGHKEKMFKIITIIGLFYVLQGASGLQVIKQESDYDAGSEVYKREIALCPGNTKLEDNADVLEPPVVNHSDRSPTSDPLSSENHQDQKPQQLDEKDEEYYRNNLGHSHVPDRKNQEKEVKKTFVEKPYLEQSENEASGDNLVLKEIEPSTEATPNSYERKDKVKNEKKETDNKNKENNRTENSEETQKAEKNCLPAKFKNTRRANNEVESSVVERKDVEFLEEVALAEKHAQDNKTTRREGKSGYYNVPLVLGDPARGYGVAPMSSAGVNLLQHNRVCYACTSASNPTCLSPDRRTTVKYCLKGHEACVTKTYQPHLPGKPKGAVILVRDCGISCDDTQVPGPQYKTCKVCHTDVCNDEPYNGAFAIKSESLMLTLLVTIVFKHV